MKITTLLFNFFLIFREMMWWFWAVDSWGVFEVLSTNFDILSLKAKSFNWNQSGFACVCIFCLSQDDAQCWKLKAKSFFFCSFSKLVIIIHSSSYYPSCRQTCGLKFPFPFSFSPNIKFFLIYFSFFYKSHKFMA